MVYMDDVNLLGKNTHTINIDTLLIKSMMVILEVNTEKKYICIWVSST